MDMRAHSGSLYLQNSSPYQGLRSRCAVRASSVTPGVSLLPKTNTVLLRRNASYLGGRYVSRCLTELRSAAGAVGVDPTPDQLKSTVAGFGQYSLR